MSKKEPMPRVTDMKIVEDFPPNFKAIEEALGDTKSADAVFCYGDTIYNPYKRSILPDVEIHEQVHSKQQGEYPEVWYLKYLSDRDFRLQEEVEAYATQYAFAKKHVHGRMLEWVLDKISESLSSEIYGNLLTYGQARSKIRSFAKHINI